MKKTCDFDKVELLYQLYEQEMYRVCFSILKDVYLAEDAVSESFVKLIRKRDRIVDVVSEEVRHFALKTAKNTAIDMYRKNVRDRKYFAGIPDNGEISGEIEPVFDVPLGAEYELLDSLNYKYRSVVECLCVEELTVRETAAVLKISETCVRKRFERARKQLETKLLKNTKDSEGYLNEKR